MTFLKTLAYGVMALGAALGHAAEVDRSGGPYVPTPPAVVQAMLETARVGPDDFVIDLGSGDGRIVLAAAARYKASGLGVDIDPELVKSSNAEAKKRGLADRATFLVQDVREADLSRATVLTLYLLPGMMANLQAKLLLELKPGTRVVSHDFGFNGWTPDSTVTVQTQEKYEITGVWTSDVHLWIVPALVQGAWRGRWSDPTGGEFHLQIKQGFQRFEGRLERNGKATDIKGGQIDGERLSFTAPAGRGRAAHYVAHVSRDQMQGEVREGDAVVARWTAVRVP